MADASHIDRRPEGPPIQPENDAEANEEDVIVNGESDFEGPSETSPLLSGNNSEPNDNEAVTGNGQPDDGRADQVDWRRQMRAVGPTLLIAAFVMSIEEGYTMATNTTHVGEDLNQMDKAVWTILAGSFTSTWVPPFLPFLVRKLGHRASMLLGTSLMAAGLILASLPPDVLLVAASRALAGFGSGSVRLISYLIIKGIVPQDQDYSLYRAYLMIAATVGRIFGSLGGFFIDWLKSKGFESPWRVPYFLMGMATLVVLYVLWRIKFPEDESDQPEEEDGESHSWRQATCDLAHPVLVACSGFSPLLMINVLTKFGFNGLVIACIVLTPMFLVATVFIEQKTMHPIFPVRVALTWPVVLAVTVRATMIFTAQQISWRLPFFAKVRAIDRKPDWALPPVYIGQGIGEYVAGKAIGLLGKEPMSLGFSLAVFLCIAQLLGNGYIAVEKLAFFPVLMVEGAANGAADNCLSSYLLKSADKRDRASVEGLSSLMSNFFGAFGLTLLTLRYEYMVNDGLSGEFGKSNKTQTLIDNTLHNVSSIQELHGHRRNFTLASVQNATEKNLFEASVGLVSGLLASPFMWWVDPALRKNA